MSTERPTFFISGVTIERPREGGVDRRAGVRLAAPGGGQDEEGGEDAHIRPNPATRVPAQGAAFAAVLNLRSLRFLKRCSALRAERHRGPPPAAVNHQLSEGSSALVVVMAVVERTITLSGHTPCHGTPTAPPARPARWTSRPPLIERAPHSPAEEYPMLVSACGPRRSHSCCR